MSNSIIFRNQFARRYNNDPREWKEDLSINDSLMQIDKNIQFFKDGDFIFLDDVYVRHYFYCCGSSAADRICFDVEQFVDELNSACAGDILECWILSETPKYIRINCPDEKGLFPVKGAY